MFRAQGTYLPISVWAHHFAAFSFSSYLMDAQGANAPPPPRSQTSNGSTSSGNDGGSIDAGEGRRSRRGSGHPGDIGREPLDPSDLNAR